MAALLRVVFLVKSYLAVGSFQQDFTLVSSQADRAVFHLRIGLCPLDRVGVAMVTMRGHYLGVIFLKGAIPLPLGLLSYQMVAPVGGPGHMRHR